MLLGVTIIRFDLSKLGDQEIDDLVHSESPHMRDRYDYFCKTATRAEKLDEAALILYLARSKQSRDIPIAAKPISNLFNNPDGYIPQPLPSNYDEDTEITISVTDTDVDIINPDEFKSTKPILGPAEVKYHKTILPKEVPKEYSGEKDLSETSYSLNNPPEPITFIRQNPLIRKLKLLIKATKRSKI